jgi:hypothetical protein
VRIGLGINRDYVTKAACDGLGIMLSEPQGQTSVSWQLDIYASTEVGEFMVGTLFTVPGSVGGVLGLAPNRLIGHAYCPGARAWKIRAIGPATSVGANISADLKTVPIRYGFGLGSGVFYAQGRTILNGGEPTAPLTFDRNDWVAPVLLQSVTAYNPGTNGVELWVMVFDLGAGPGPVLGNQPTKGLSLDLPIGATGQLTLNPPVMMANGLWVAVSSTPDTYTPSVLTCRILTTVAV